MKKVRIDKCTNIDYWYYRIVGDTVAVDDIFLGQVYMLLGSNNLGIYISDCTVISDDTEQEEKVNEAEFERVFGAFCDDIKSNTKEFVLPEKWCVSHCKEALVWIKKNAEIGGHRISKSNWYMFPCNSLRSNWSKDFPEGYTEITKDQFFAYVLEKELKKEEPKWQIAEVGKKSLIAKAGEYVKIVDFGGIVNLRDSGFTLNKPYELYVNLYEGGEFDVVADDDGDKNGFSKTFKIGIKFERCEAPVPVVQETTENDYALSVDEEHLEHEEKINNIEVAIALAGFKFTRKDLDMLVSLHDLVIEYGGKLDLDTITETQVKVSRRHDLTV